MSATGKDYVSGVLALGNIARTGQSEKSQKDVLELVRAAMLAVDRCIVIAPNEKAALRKALKRQFSKLT